MSGFGSISIVTQFEEPFDFSFPLMNYLEAEPSRYQNKRN